MTWISVDHYRGRCDKCECERDFHRLFGYGYQGFVCNLDHLSIDDLQAGKIHTHTPADLADFNSNPFKIERRKEKKQTVVATTFVPAETDIPLDETKRFWEMSANERLDKIRQINRDRQRRYRERNVTDNRKST